MKLLSFLIMINSIRNINEQLSNQFMINCLCRSIVIRKWRIVFGLLIFDSINLINK